MFILSSISISLEIWSVNHNSVYEHSESKVSDEISNNWPNYLWGTNVYKTLESCS